MPKNNESFNVDLDGFLRSCGFNKITYYSSAEKKSVPTPDKADQFKFHYQTPTTDYGSVVITTGGGKVTVYYNQNAMQGGVDSGWTKFLGKLKDWAIRYGQGGFDIQNMDKLSAMMQKRNMEQQEEQLLEGWAGNKTTSWNDGTPQIRMIVKHTRPIGEGDLRYHHIEKIFLENADGERILVPSKKPSVGRAFARHLAEGGLYNDQRWNHIKELAEDYSALGGFVRATRSGVFLEGAESVVESAVEHYSNLKETIRRLAGSRGYSNYFESWQPTIMEGGSEDSYGELFTVGRLDPRIERALPVLQKLGVKSGTIAEAEEFSRWAESIAETVKPEDAKKVDGMAELLSGDDLVVGADAMSIKGQLDDLLPPGAKRDNLYNELQVLAKADPDNDAKPAIITWLQKNRGEEFYGKVLDAVESGAKTQEPEPAAPPPPPPPAPAQPAQQDAGSAPPAPPGVEPETTGAAPIQERSKAKKSAPLKQRNPVAKYAKRSGAGSHTKRGYQRQQKHKGKLGEEMDDFYTEDDAVGTAIRRRIVARHLDLIKQYGLDEVGNAVDDVASSVGRVTEIGTSDVSGWVKRVEDYLHNLHSTGDPTDLDDPAPMEAVEESLTRIRKLSGL